MSHSSEEILKQSLDEASQDVLVGGIYAHYKDPTKTYEVRMLAVSELDESIEVVYRALYGMRLTFTRSLNSWCDEVEANGSPAKRFTLLE